MENQDSASVDLRVRRTHKLLWDALFSLMKEQDFESISVKDICDWAMVHRTTFYKHYQDKYDLLHRGIESTYHTLMAEMAGAKEGTSGFKLFFENVAAHQDFYRLMLFRKRGWYFQDMLKDFFAESILSETSQTGKAGENWPAPLPLLAQFYAGAIVSTLAWWLNNAMPYSSEKMGAYIQKLLVG